MAPNHPAARPPSSTSATSSSVTSSTKLRTVLRMVPLLCAAWCGNALAVEVIYQGPAGSSGLNGAGPGIAGTAGGTAPLASYVLFGTDAANLLVVNGGTGGTGGNGGNGASGNPGQSAGAAGAGGAGAEVSAVLSTVASAAGGHLAVTANGGLGGSAGQPGQAGGQAGTGALAGVGGNAFANGVLTSSFGAVASGVAQANGGQGGRASGGLNSAAGGDALSNLTSVVFGSSAVGVGSIATGGQGGAATTDGTTGGKGGNASANAGIANPGATLSAYTQETRATGGAGGHANLDSDVGLFAMGGNGGDAVANTSNANNLGVGSLTLVQSATGGAGGESLLAYAGRGGDATSTIASNLGGTLVSNASIAGTATGGAGGSGVGSPFEQQMWGAPGAGGNASSTVALTASAPAAGSWNAVMAANSTALAGAPGNNAFSGQGGTADATVTVAGYGRVSGTALASGSSGGDQGGYGNARATVDSNYSAVASATANGGGAYFNGGAPATARADATSGWHASANAVAMSGSGRFGFTDPASAIAIASVNRPLGAPPLSSALLLVPEARARAHASFRGSEVLARSSYRDANLGAMVVATATSAQPAEFYQPDAASAANVGGQAYGPWIPDPDVGMVASYASALPDPASLAPLMAASPNLAAAFSGAQLLGAGTMGAMFFPFTATAEFSVPFTAGRHLLLGLGLPFISEFDSANFEFSVSNGATELYAGSFDNQDQATLFFADRVLDLGVFNSSTLDLVVRFSFSNGIYGFNYVLGAGNALTPVPEPGTWLMLVLGLALLAWRGGALRSASR